MNKQEQSTDVMIDFCGIQEEQLTIFRKKNADYGNAFDRFGAVGVMIRLRDKLDRFINLAEGGDEVALVKTEALRDTLLDLSNYSTMAVMLGDDSPSGWGPGE